MGKYMKKTKVAGEVALMEVGVPHQLSLGVRTRARTLALQRLQRPAAPVAGDGSYLQLRSRRLEKPPGPKSKGPPCMEEPSPNPSPSPSPSPSPRSRAGPVNSGSVVGSVSVRSCCSKRKEAGASEASLEIDAGVEVSFGENVLDVDTKGRNARETTPCSLIRDSETIGTPGSTTRPTISSATNKRIQNSMRGNIPTAQEIEEFFVGAEQLQQRTFAERYNFDPVKDRPLPGRYEWVKLDD